MGLSKSENWERNQRKGEIVSVLDRGKGWGSFQGLSASNFFQSMSYSLSCCFFLAIC